MWWSSDRAHQEQEQAISQIERKWDQVPDSGTSSGKPPVNATESPSDQNSPGATQVPSEPPPGTTQGPEPPRTTPVPGFSAPGQMSRQRPGTRVQGGEALGILHIPRLGARWRVPIFEGISRARVLNRGFVGHYPSARPGEVGNFAIAAHSITHGAPFANLNRLRPGDRIHVETSTTWFTYETVSGPYLTSPRNVSVVAPIPRHSGFKAPGRYITLTTCWPPITSAKRMIFWGHLVDTHPRFPNTPRPQ
ncbi:class E sortase [Streptomyces lavendulocolor]|uniref:class E sortase n=1 Tax=Streptomyces lavendulocolor TaxID=67316 RepID=UPI0033EBA930